MKKALLTGCLLVLRLAVLAQTGEEKEKKLVQAITSFSAATLYNTYGIIGSISDGFGADAYDAETVKNLLNAQQELMDNLVKVVEDLKSSGTVSDSITINYITTAAAIMKNLKQQARLMTDYARTKKRSLLDEYEKQRNNNWKDISKLMGVKE
ncbi:MAG: hypothetical protein JNM19_16240 [Chitinophagaceae bacterium]|nr:hypothetical protein [Chitinophagaceae bacterium]